MNFDSVVVCVENAINKLPKSNKQAIRKGSKEIQREEKHHWKLRRSNEMETVNHKSNDVIYLPADKGNKLVIFDQNKYKQRMSDIIEKVGYRRMKKNPLPQMTKIQ